MASNMGIPEKKNDTLLYIIIVCCIIAFPFIVLAGYILEMTADKNGNIQIFEAVGRLDVKYRSVLLLFYCDGMSVSETARTLGISDSAVTTRLHRARQLLKNELERRNFNG